MDALGDIYFAEPSYGDIRVLRPTGSTTAPPVITGVLNAASFQPGVEAGSWVMIQGTGLANTARTWTAAEVAAGNLPTSLDGVSVAIDGKPAFVSYISPTQINVQAPSDGVAGMVIVTVTNNGVTSAPAVAQLQPVAPGFFVDAATGVAIASRLSDFAAVGTSKAPAKAGDIVVLWATGFGSTKPDVPAGTVVTGIPAAVNTPTVTVGGVQAQVVSTVLTAGSAGLYQITIVIPTGVAAGAATLQASVGGTQTQSGVSLYIGQN